MAATWSVLLEHGWVAYDPAVTAQLEAAFTAGAPLIPSITIRGQVYSIGFDVAGAGNHIQTNHVYSTQRPVKRSTAAPPGWAGTSGFGFPATAANPAAAVPAAPPLADWQVAGDHGMITYSAAHAAVLEDCFNRQAAACTLGIGQYIYTIEFAWPQPPGTPGPPVISQLNTRFQTRRTVSRVPKPMPVAIVSAPTSPTPPSPKRSKSGAGGAGPPVAGKDAWKADCAPLAPVLLSVACQVVAGGATVVTLQHALLDKPAIEALLRANVPGLDSLHFRNGRQGVLSFIQTTYANGLHMVQGNPALVTHSRNAVRFIFDRAPGLGDRERRTHLRTLAEAFTACQAEQARTIDAIYGELSGRDRGLRDQVLAMLDQCKQRTLDEVTLHFHPGSDLSQRLPHIQSRYRIELGAELGLSGTETAKLDVHVEAAIPQSQLRSFAQLFRAKFSTEDFVQAVVADVNQQDPEAERYILPKTLFKWAQPENKAGNKGFDSYSIFFNDDEKDLYEGAPTEENLYTQAFVRPGVVVDVLKRLL